MRAPAPFEDPDHPRAERWLGGWRGVCPRKWRPFSKLLHAPGVFFSPTRYPIDNPRERRYAPSPQ